MKKIEVYNQEGKKIRTVDLDEKVFDGKVDKVVLHQAVVTFLANQRKGLAKTKRRGEVRGGGAKPWRQKGTGRARVGSIRSPLWRGGGVTFGPQPRDYSKNMPRRMKIRALKSALNAKLKDGEIMIVDTIEVKEPKTKLLFEILKKLKLNDIKTVFVTNTISENMKLSSKNLKRFEYEKADNLSSYAALNCKKLLFTFDAFKKTEERIKKWLD